MARRKVVILAEPPEEVKRNDKLIEHAKEILTSCRQDSLPKAVLADIVDSVPYLRILTHLFRVYDGVKNDDLVGAALQGADLFVTEGGAFKDVGIVIPTNTILTYKKLRDEGKEPLKELKEKITKIIKK